MPVINPQRFLFPGPGGDAEKGKWIAADCVELEKFSPAMQWGILYWEMAYLRSKMTKSVDPDDKDMKMSEVTKMNRIELSCNVFGFKCFQ